jgi:hypothetical protein
MMVRKTVITFCHNRRNRCSGRSCPSSCIGPWRRWWNRQRRRARRIVPVGVDLGEEEITFLIRSRRLARPTPGIAANSDVRPLDFLDACCQPR